MTTRRFLSSALLALTALLWFASAAEAQFEPRFYPPGSTTIAAYYVPHLNITVAKDSLEAARLYGKESTFNHPNAEIFIRVLNHPNAPFTSYLGIDTWRLPRAIKHDPNCTGLTATLWATLGGSGGTGWHCTGSEMGWIYHEGGHGTRYSHPTNWPFTNLAGTYWTGSRSPGTLESGIPQWAVARNSYIFRLDDGWQEGLNHSKKASVWAFTDGDPLGGPNLKLSAPDLDFGFQHPYTTSSPQSITLRNDGNGDATKPLLISSISNSDSSDFPEQPGSCSTPPITLAKNEHCTISYNFAPKDTWARKVTVTIVSNSLTSPDSIALFGTGGDPESVTPSRIR